jgi:hypothetical protein
MQALRKYQPRSGGMFVAHGFNRGVYSNEDSHRAAVACGPGLLRCYRAAVSSVTQFPTRVAPGLMDMPPRCGGYLLPH